MTVRHSVRKERPKEIEGLVRLDQLELVARLAPILIVSMMSLIVLMTWLFWEPRFHAFFVGLNGLAWPFALGSLAALRLWLSRRRLADESVEATRHFVIAAALGGIIASAIPFRLCSDTGPDGHLLVSVIASGMLGAGLALSAVPRVAVAYAVPIVAASFWSLMTYANSTTTIMAGLLIYYAGFLYFLADKLSQLIQHHALERLNFKKEHELSSLLLKDFEANANDWLWETDRACHVTHGPERLERALSLRRGSIIGAYMPALLRSLIHPDSRPALRQCLVAMRHQSSFRDVTMHLRSGDHDRWFLLTGKPIFDHGRFTGYRGVGSDITSKHLAETQLRYLALHDSMTGLVNRNELYKRLSDALGKLEELGEVAVLCLDLDDFKQVNDTFGHASGDQLLVEAGARMREVIGPRGILARIAGDEFTILLSGRDACRREAITTLAAQIIAALALPFEIGSVQAYIGVSIGAAIAPQHGMHQIVQRADLALYQSKARGKNSFTLFEAALNERAEARRLLANDLRPALERHEFFLAFQPLVNAATHRIEGFEALARWQHPVRGLVSPLEFIPLAEQQGLITELGDWILREACETALKWPERVRIAVNISPIQFLHSDLLGVVRRVLAETGLAPERLELELTESSFLEDSEATRTTVEALHDLGVKLSLDDFGTGYSSLSYLRRIRFDRIKVDRSFVERLPEDDRDLAIVRAVVDIATILGMAISAEGVETEAQARCLLQQGCHQLQGYLFGRPMVAEAALDLVRADAARRPRRKVARGSASAAWRL